VIARTCEALARDSVRRDLSHRANTIAELVTPALLACVTLLADRAGWRSGMALGAGLLPAIVLATLLVAGWLTLLGTPVVAVGHVWERLLGARPRLPVSVAGTAALLAAPTLLRLGGGLWPLAVAGLGLLTGSLLLMHGAHHPHDHHGGDHDG
jgi:hypothetical protein